MPTFEKKNRLQKSPYLCVGQECAISRRCFAPWKPDFEIKKKTVLQSGEKKRSSSKMSLKDLGPDSRKAWKLFGPEGKF